MNLPFLRPKIEHLDLYLSKKAYDKALIAIQSELQKKPRDTQLLRRQGKIQELADDFDGAIDTYLELAHEYILGGFHTRAIALYKRILEIDPTRKDILAELARLIDREGGSTAEDSITGEEEKKSHETPALEENEPRLEISTDSAVTDHETSEEPAEVSTSNADPLTEVSRAPDILETLPLTSPPTEPSDESSRAKELEASTLFTLFDSEALEEVLTSTNLRSYQEGDIIVTEGEEGASLFLLVEGQVKVFTRGKKGEHIPLAELGPGDLFGEVSVLHGKPRTATITAKSLISAIEVTKADIDRISANHPQVREVLETFCEQRAQDAIEALIGRARADQ